MLRLTEVRDGERGAIAMIVAMLFGFGVMIGLGALTIDVGNINADRRQLQNGADAVVLAFAQECAMNATCDPTVSNSTLAKLANANAADGFTTISRVDGASGTPLTGKPAICGSIANATNLPECPTTWVQSLTNLQECPKNPPSGVNYVRAYTQTTLNAAGSHILPYSFGAAITGVGSGANQQACASAIFGQPVGSAAPITLSLCEWQASTGYTSTTPSVFPENPLGSPGYRVSSVSGPEPIWPAPAPQLPLLPATTKTERIIGLQGTATTSGCGTWNGHDIPGGFGYLSSSSSCNATAAVGGWIQVSTGNNLVNTCELSGFHNKIMYLPVFDCVATGTVSAPPTGNPSVCNKANGNTSWYRIVGYAKYYLSGYKVGGSVEKARTQPVTPQVPCSANDRCLSGWFLKGLVAAPIATYTSGGPPLGAYSLQMSR